MNTHKVGRHRSEEVKEKCNIPPVAGDKWTVLRTMDIEGGSTKLVKFLKQTGVLAHRELDGEKDL